MSAISIQVPFPVFQDRDGQPLDNGYVWIGTANLNPITNPVATFYDAALTIVAVQPLRTINGYISRAGTPSQVYVDGVNFSILVQDSKGSMVYNFPNGTGIDAVIDACNIDYIPPFTGAVAYPVCEKLEQTLSVLDFNADPTGVIDSTIAFQAAIDALPANGGTVYIPGGSYLIGTLDMPNDPKTVNLIGESMNGVELKMATAAGPVIRKAQIAGRITGATMQNFTVRANAASDKTNLTHVAMFLSGWNNSFFKNIAYQSFTNAIGAGSVGVFMKFTGNPYLTYQNVCEGINVQISYGPSRCILLGNNGTTVFENPNIFEIRNSWFYALNGCDVIIDGYDNTGMTVRACEFEQCTGATAVGLSQSTLVEGCWFELLSSNISTNTAATVDGSGSVILNNYFSGAGTSFIDSINVRPLWIGNNGSGQTVTGQGVLKLNAPSGGTPAAPTLTVNSGSVGFVSNNVTVPMDATAQVTYKLNYTFTPAAAQAYLFTFTIPNDSISQPYLIKGYTVGVIRGANGDPKAWALDSTNSNSFWVGFTSTDAHTISVLVTFRAPI